MLHACTLIDSEPRFPLYRSTSTRFSHLAPSLSCCCSCALHPPLRPTPLHININLYIRIRAPRRNRRSDCFIHVRVYSIRSSNKVLGFLNVFIVLSNSVRARHPLHLISYLSNGRQYISSRIRLAQHYIGLPQDLYI
jgi:hypothetical protein